MRFISFIVAIGVDFFFFEKKTAVDSPFVTGDEGPVIIDLMIVYTPAAAVWAADREGGINNTIAAVMNMSQLALDNSNTHIVLNLVHSAEVDYVEMHTNDDLRNLTIDNDGYMDEVHIWRNAYGADVVVLLEETGYSHSGLVTATPYHYKAWSNNSGTYSPGVTATATTLCGQLSLFPYSEQFNSGSIPECCQVVDIQGNGQVWSFVIPDGITINTSTANNGFAILDSDNYSSGRSV